MLKLYILLTGVWPAMTFNVVAKQDLQFKRPDENQFGQGIIPYKDGILVASPSPSNQILYYCTLEKDCIAVTTEEAQTKGLKPIVSTARYPDGNQFVVCQQARSRISMNEDLNGQCRVMSDERTVELQLNPAAQVVEQMETHNSNNNNNNNVNSNNNNNNNSSRGDDDDEEDEDAGTEIAFVLDGSGSIEPEDFEKAKDFISNVMRKVWENCFICNFAVVQYGNIVRPELLLRENDDTQNALDKIKRIQQIKHVTITASAINYVLEHVFVAENGSRENSRKMIIVLTDGEIFMDNMTLSSVLNSTKMDGITRIAVGVGEALKSTKALRELKEIASVPHDQHLFMVDNYAALETYLSQLETSIVGIEGSQKGAAFLFNLAEAGFSSHVAQDGAILFGAVGAYDWSGGLIVKEEMNRNMKFINTTSTEKGFSYLGYSVTSTWSSDRGLYVSGAPRYNLTGAVLLFDQDSHELIQTLPGEQVGSYFGVELCALDVDRDRKTDHLLVGAPFFHLQGEEGKVYIYTLDQGKFRKMDWEWRGEEQYAFARFGAAIADVGDIDRNGFNDVVVGAPLEEGDHRSLGSIYVYNGYDGGVRTQHSQRIAAANVETGLRFFGQAVSRMSDTYIAVGSQGGVSLLQVVPVIEFKPSVSVHPETIPRSYQSGQNAGRQFRLQMCFQTPRGGLLNPGEKLPILYQLDLDAAQEEKRLSFSNGTSEESTIFILTKAISCLTKTDLMFTGCKDCFSPVEIRLSFQLQDTSDVPLRVMNMYSPKELTVQLPFVLNCDDQRTCKPQISLSNSKLSTEMIVAGAMENLNLNVNLMNKGESSFLTSLLVTYPPALQFNKVTKLIAAAVCMDDVEVSQLTCNISHPELQTDAQANFSISWQLGNVVPDSTPLTIKSSLTCENNKSKILDAKNYTFRVKKALSVQLTGNVDTSVLNIAEDRTTTEPFRFTFEILGENRYNAAIMVTINVTCSSPHLEFSINIKAEKVKCAPSETDPRSGNGRKTVCEVIKLPGTIVVMGEVHINDNQARSYIRAMASLSYDQEQYEVEDHEAYQLVSQDMTINKLKVVRSEAAVVGGSIGGFILLAVIIFLLIKCGFFRRRYQDNLKSQTDLSGPDS